MIKCAVCGNDIINTETCLSTKNLRNRNAGVCMGCEFKKIGVWHITLFDEPKNGYYDTDISNIVDMLKECSYGEGYTIKRELMKAMQYYGLPEFDGF